MKTGAQILSKYINFAQRYMCAVTVSRALDSSGRCLGLLFNAQSPRCPTLVRFISTTDGSEYFRSVKYSTSHYFFQRFPAMGGGSLLFFFGSHIERITLSYTYKETLGSGLGSELLTAWPFRYTWGDTCPVSIKGAKSTAWADVLSASRAAGVALPRIELPDCAAGNILRWSDAAGRAYALPLYPSTPLRSGSGGEVSDSYTTPPLLPSEQTAFLTLCENICPFLVTLGLQEVAIPLTSQSFKRTDDETIFTVKFSTKWK